MPPSVQKPSALSFAPLPTPPVSGSPIPRGLTLIFHPDHPCSTHISDAATGELLYLVESHAVQEPLLRKRTVTTVRRSSTETVIAQFEWGDFFSSNTVALMREIAGGLAGKWNEDSKGKGKEEEEDLVTMPGSSWLKKSSLPFKDTVTYKDPDRRSLKWKGFAPGLSLELHSTDNPAGPVAKFYKARRLSITGTGKLRSKVNWPRLVIDTTVACEGGVEEVLVAFLYLEKIRRERDEEGFKVIAKQPYEAQKHLSRSHFIEPEQRP